MATTWTYTFISGRPNTQPIGGSDTDNGNTTAVLSCVGPATSVSDGMTIASIATDFDYIERMYGFQWSGKPAYEVKFQKGSTAALGKIRVITPSTGILLAGGTNLTTMNFLCKVDGSGPLAGA